VNRFAWTSVAVEVSEREMMRSWRSWK